MSEASQKEPSSVSVYIARVNQALASQGGRVKGEVTYVKQSGKAVYFSIKDKDVPAILECMIWETLYRANGLEIKIGDEVIVTGAPDIYAPFGKFSFKTQTIEYAGDGALKQAYDRLKATLTVRGSLKP